MKAYIQPETIEVLLLSELVMAVASKLPAAPGYEDPGSLMFDAPGNKRRQL